ncbi:MAG: hypothetical protein GF329_06515 [Candidatus Lokiarchaeota archaeon]|nr:hypothetical protein [Candidatus Lokiarchaeota archaeon]
MGLWSKLKEIFAGKSVETFQGLEEDLKKLFRKCNLRLVALVGTTSKIKGLPLIYAAENEDEIRVFSAKLINLIEPIKDLSDGKKIKNARITYEDQIIYTEPILENISFLAIYKQKNDIYNIKQWINNNKSNLKLLVNKE